MGSGFSKMKKQAKMMQQQISQMRDQMQNAEFAGSSGAGLVSLILNGEKELKKISIKPECLSDAEGLQDLIVAAFADASAKVDAESQTHNIPFLS